MALLKKIVLGSLSNAKKLGSGARISGSIKRSGKKYLNLGCQTNFIPGWLNVDVLTFPGAEYMDATRRWPIPDGALELILCEHMIEHVPKEAGWTAIQEAYRTLEPGGVLRMVTPNVDAFARMCLDPDNAEARIYLPFARSRTSEGTSAVDVINGIFYGYGHRYIYSPGEMRKILEQAGFVNIVDTRAGVPADQRFADKEGHPKLVGLDVNATEAFAIEATKPA